MAAAFDANKAEFAILSRALFAQQAGELPMVGFEIRLRVVGYHSQSDIPIPADNAGSGARSLNRSPSWRRLCATSPNAVERQVKFLKAPGWSTAAQKLITAPREAPPRDSGGRFCEGEVADVHMPEKFGAQELRVSRAAKLRRQIEVAQRYVNFGKALRVAYGRYDGFEHDAATGKKVDPLVCSPIHAGKRAPRRIEDVGPILEHDDRKAALRFEP